MTTRLLLALALLSAACNTKDTVSFDDTGDPVVADDSGDTSDGDGVPDDSAADDSSAPDCEATIESVSPADGAEEITTTAAVTASLSAAISEGDYAATMSGPDGAVASSASLSSDGTELRVSADSELDRDADYTVSITVCDDSEEVTFHTVGEPVGDLLEGRVFDVDLTTVTWNQPPNGSLLAGFLDSAHLLFMVEGVDTAANTIDFVGALGEEDPGLQQDICTEPFDFDPADFSSDPAFQVGPQDTSFTAQGETLDVYELTASGAFNATGEALRNMRVTGFVDVGDFVVQGANVCDYAEFLLGAGCVECPNSNTGEERCLELDVEAPSAPWQPNVTVDPNNNPADHAECN